MPHFLYSHLSFYTHLAKMFSVQEPELIKDGERRSLGENAQCTPKMGTSPVSGSSSTGDGGMQGTVCLLHVLQIPYPASGLLFSVNFWINAWRILHCWGWSFQNLWFQPSCTKEISPSALKLHEWHADTAVISSLVSSVLNSYWSPELFSFGPIHSWCWAVHSSVHYSPLFLWYHWD